MTKSSSTGANGSRIALHFSNKFIIDLMKEFIGTIVFADYRSRQIAVSASEGIQAAEQHLLRYGGQVWKVYVAFELRLVGKPQSMLGYIDRVIGDPLYYWRCPRYGEDEAKVG